MKKYFFIIVFTFLFTNCIPSIENKLVPYNEYIIVENMKYHFPLRITDFESICVDTNFIITGYTNSYPPCVIKKIKDFNFEILLTVRVESRNSDWPRPLYMELERVGSNSDTLKLNRYPDIMYSGNYYQFPFIVTAASGERIIFKLGLKNNVGSKAIFAHPNDPFRTVDVFF